LIKLNVRGCRIVASQEQELIIIVGEKKEQELILIVEETAYHAWIHA